jgi:hypothetical protein
LDPGDLIAVLEVMGGNLVTLFDNAYPLDDAAPDEIGSLCPKLQSTSLSWPADPYYLRSFECSTYLRRLSRRNHGPIRDTFPLMASERQASQWLRLVGRGLRPYKIIYINDMVMEYIFYLLDYDISPHDSALVKFQDFIARIC